MFYTTNMIIRLTRSCPDSVVYHIPFLLHRPGMWRLAISTVATAHFGQALYALYPNGNTAGLIDID
jgi:hypothetical protein